MGRLRYVVKVTVCHKDVARGQNTNMKEAPEELELSFVLECIFLFFFSS